MPGLLVAVATLIIVVLVALLWSPIDVDVAARRDPAFGVQVRVSWLFGLVTTESKSTREESPHPRSPSPETSDDGSGSFSKLMRIARSRGFLAGVARFVRRLVTGVEIRRARLWARAGFDDPGDTGRFLAIFFPVTQYLQPSSRYSVDLEPDFHEAVFLFDARTVLRIVPARVIGPALAFVLSPATLRAMFAAARG